MSIAGAPISSAAQHDSADILHDGTAELEPSVSSTRYVACVQVNKDP
jgi:hypothetical protein